ncbi:MAG: hypothetical protein LYZ69_00440 [Nitrososphaerales archaeon]|nr:hypothetical protein [Nitrososphaerales archaeon]
MAFRKFRRPELLGGSGLEGGVGGGVTAGRGGIGGAAATGRGGTATGGRCGG